MHRKACKQHAACASTATTKRHSSRAVAGSRPCARAHAARAAGGAKQRPRRCCSTVVARATMEQENKQMAEAEARWDAQLRDGIVKNVMAKDVKQHVEDGWTVLDVRPPNETKKVHVKDSVEVPLFVPDNSLDPASLLKQMSAFGMGGWWLGGVHTKPNNAFLQTVQNKVPKDSKVLVACQKGLRSLAACEQLSRAGYKDIAWLNGGFDNSTAGEVETRDGKDIRMGGIGGLSSVLGWTEVQQESAGPMGGFKGVLFLVGLVVVLDVGVFAYEQISVMQGRTPFG